MVNMLHHKKRVNDGFSVSKLDISMLQTRNTENCPKKYEDVELQALLDEDDSQKQLAEQLSVSQQVVSNRLQEMGKIQKIGRWVPHELNERQRGAKTHVKFCSNDTEESHSCIVSLLGKSGFCLRIPSAKNYG